MLREILDPAVEHVQHAKQQRERIYDDSAYFTKSKHPEDAPDWTFRKNYDTKVHEESEDWTNYEKDADDDEFEDWTNFEKSKDTLSDEEFHYQFPEGLDYYGSDFIRNSAEMNAIRPEDLDERGESSTANVSQQ